VSGGLWRDHPATPRQRRLAFQQPSREPHARRVTQADVLLSMLRAARAEGRGLDLPDILAAGIAQYSARFNELRSRSFVIENELERTDDGRVLSRYFLRFDPDNQRGTW